MHKRIRGGKALFAGAIARCTTIAVVSTVVPQGLAAEQAARLKVITYNVQFLPGLASFLNERNGLTYRARTLGRKLSCYDIVGLNEVFDRGPRTLLLGELERGWGNAYNAVVVPEPPRRFGSGLAIASRLPLAETHSMVYSVASSVRQYGIRADGFAAKGALHARIRRDGADTAAATDFVDVFVTHLEARVDDIRVEQFKELAAFVTQHAGDRNPVLVMGDFNTKGERSYRAEPMARYHILINSLRASLPQAELVDLWRQLRGEEQGGTTEQESSATGHRIDYIFLANPRRGWHLRPLAIRVNPFLDARVTALSDHSAVEADFEWP